MYLQSVVLEGFKSYAERTTVGPLHERFNAVTGLNGSGKSNVLDGICFVMGIKSLQQMRVAKLEELIYKRGQAGVTKASVTLVFKVTDRARAPLGFADHDKITVSRQIALGGRERYLINGHAVRPAQIHQFFLSVQLNVNNPHFLIMQGRITKVVRMRPVELALLIEEAAGTKIYEARRAESARRIATKQAKLEEVEKLIHGEIEPTLVDLKKDKESYLSSLRTLESAAQLSKYCTAYTYYRADKKAGELRSELKTAEAAASALKASREAADARLAQLRRELDAAAAADARAEAARRLREATAALRQAKNELSVNELALKRESEAAAADAAEAAAAAGAAEALAAEAAALRAGAGAELAAAEAAAAAVARLRAAETAAAATLEELRTGATAGPSLRRRLAEAAQRERALRSRREQRALRVTHLQAEVRDANAAAAGGGADGGGVESSLAASHRSVKDRLSSVESQLEALEPRRTAFARAQAGIADERAALAAHEEKVQLLARRCFLALRLAEEHGNSLPPGVVGTAAVLFRVADHCEKFETGLEEAGRGRLFHVVTADDEVAQKLLERYRSVRRLTCIPLNRIRAECASDQRLASIKSTLDLPPDANAVMRPIDALEFDDPKLRPALVHVFGTALLCETAALAQKVSETPSIKAFAITASGDQYNPAGAISGGSSAGLGGLLRFLKEHRAAAAQLAACRQRVADLARQMADLEQDASKYIALQGEEQRLQIVCADFERRMHEAGGASAAAAAVAERLQAAQRELLDAEQALEQLSIELADLRRQVAEDEKLNVTQKIEAAEKARAAAKKELKTAEARATAAAEKTREVAHRIGVLEEQGRVAEARAAELTAAAGVAAVDARLAAAKTAAAVSREKVAAAKKAVDDVEAACSEHASRDEALQLERTSLDQELVRLAVDLERGANNVSAIKQQLKDVKKILETMDREHPWLHAAKPKFNCATADDRFDFRDEKEASRCYQKLEALKREAEGLRKRVDPNILGTVENAERQLQELQQKRQQLIKDRATLERFIEELDAKKRAILAACREQVGANFAAIFAILLPGAHASLEPVAPESAKKVDDLSAGLEIAVKLNRTKKSSLAELSGGQRSLLALALVLALLQYKPAPLYILDEIDAALDLSHTQRIGQLIRTRFAESQFIIVSLKDNMFNYADVLFRTSFAGGTSRVIRQVSRCEPRDKENAAPMLHSSE